MEMTAFTYKVQQRRSNSVLRQKITIVRCNKKKRGKTLQKFDLVEISDENECYNLCGLTFYFHIVVNQPVKPTCH